MIPRVVAVVDLGFGDAGKGLLVDFLARSRPTALIVRFNGGAQAGHNVVTPDGLHHTFAQLGSGTFVAGVRTHLASRVVVHPTALLREAEHLASIGVRDALERLSVSDQAPVVTPFHQAASRLRELARGNGRHGSCGVGVGEVVRDALVHGEDVVRVSDLADPAPLARRLARVQERVRCSVEDALAAAKGAPGSAQESRVLDDPAMVKAWVDATRPFVQRVAAVSDERLVDALRSGQQVVFEGAQGVLLDEDWGFHPYTTWSRCTFAVVDELLHDVGSAERAFRLGVARVHAHRHGPGPLPTESAALTAAIGERHNVDGPWQGPFRVGWPDLVLARYARRACAGIDGLALTHFDVLARLPRWFAAVSYDGGRVVEWPLAAAGDLTARAEHTRRLFGVRPDLVDVDPRELQEAFADAYAAPVLLRSTGPRATDVHGAP